MVHAKPTPKNATAPANAAGAGSVPSGALKANLPSPGHAPPTQAGAASNRGSSMDKQQRLMGTLDYLMDEKGVLGAALITRDGICLMNRLVRELSPEIFSAMTATLMGAAETALAEVAAGPTRRVIAETEKMKMIVVGATEELLLVALVEASLSLDRLIPLVEGAVDNVTEILSHE